MMNCLIVLKPSEVYEMENDKELQINRVAIMLPFFLFEFLFLFCLFVIVLTHVGGHKRSICCYLVWKSEKTNSYCQTLLSNQLNQKVIPRCIRCYWLQPC